jgi:hypothetical protein
VALQKAGLLGRRCATRGSIRSTETALGGTAREDWECHNRPILWSSETHSPIRTASHSVTAPPPSSLLGGKEFCPLPCMMRLFNTHWARRFEVAIGNAAQAPRRSPSDSSPECWFWGLSPLCHTSISPGSHFIPCLPQDVVVNLTAAECIFQGSVTVQRGVWYLDQSSTVRLSSLGGVQATQRITDARVCALARGPVMPLPMTTCWALIT